MSDQQTPEAGVEQTQDTAPAIDLTPVNERFDRLEQTISQFASQQQPAAQEEADPYGGMDPDLLRAIGYDPDEYAQQFQQEQQGGIADPAAFQQALQQQVQQAVGPLQQQLQNMQLESLAAKIETQYPELQDPAVAGPVVERATSMAQQLVQSLGLPPEAVNTVRQHPGLIENAYLAHKASTQAVDEASAQPNHTQLENPAGAGPEGSEPSYTDRLLASTQGNKFWGTRG